ncbi:ESX secretion-associated protein EspG [Mycobacterium heckeshornense]|uniref:ESX-2 secretion-associated protein EspG2 n=1 Tax=Mycobacterium heckeshornense TaxID=110505 RepID=A0A2G8AYI1_9MYCO|nr:ESX secretion-associated protein EspG [Mycobacterium heckeshornense]KMV21377.1 secretion protein EspG [Mycobacterium heckeshornense]MCV7034368.1 ESX secretion-associated protein EspG [Mycobacterium heckeshornense]PIJ30557.1 ESX secretion-associated protein EspG [Mycobacterium heckeshornense]BCO33607.1 ESX-2 secretion-associated protein EspG2 [Mycobacterium heckeshornense]
MLTTTVDGLWVLQVLTGIEMVAPELALRPILPSVETPQLALAHPIAAELQAAGVIDDSGNVDPIVVEWLTVLARRDVALLIYMQGTQKEAPDRAILARFAQWWVVMERSENLVRIGGAGTSTTESSANEVVMRQIERLCGTLEPAPLQPVTVDVDQVMVGVTNRETLRRQLLSQRLDGDQLQILMMAADTKRSARAFVVATQSGVDTGQPTRKHVEQSVVAIADTPEGRLVGEHISSSGKRWMIIGPGTTSSIADAINRMVRRLPANQEWFSYRKVV